MMQDAHGQPLSLGSGFFVEKNVIATNLKPEELALVAAHDWDINGAGRAGLTTGYVARAQPICSPAMKQADVAGQSLTEVVRGLLALSA